MPASRISSNVIFLLVVPSFLKMGLQGIDTVIPGFFAGIAELNKKKV